ncbi:MAG: hypothetical protein O3A10_12405 [Chloroflexi bacterium]|nr:hypothetical protein [Chloroflexota bacterium]MDA1146229.1 hypothetical protein [Chloroflexota bacterium]
MKTLFALGTGAVLGTIAALWIAARREHSGATMPAVAATGATRAVAPASSSETSDASEEISA